MKKESHNFDDFLNRLPDFRRSQGLRYPLKAVLSMIIMSIITGGSGYREFARFMRSNAAALTTAFDLKHGVPSHVTIRTILNGIDLSTINEQFRQWTTQNYPTLNTSLEAVFISFDGKALRSTVENPNTSLQDFVFTVSAFAHHSGLTLAFEQFQNGKESEPKIVQQMIQTLGLKDVIFRMDAIHCKKKHYKSS